MALNASRFAVLAFLLQAVLLRAETIYVSTNDPAGNRVLILNRATDGTLAVAASYPAGGNGTGGNLESQSPLTLSRDNRFLFCVNAATNTVAVFRMGEGALESAGSFNSGGVRPTSLTERGGVLYVLNEGTGNNVAGFNVGPDGTLFPISGGTFPLTRPDAGGAQVAFHPTEDILIVTERFSNRLGVYELDGLNAIVRGPRIRRSSGRFPFGFAFTDKGHLLVSEAFGGRRGGSATSSYRVTERGGIRPVSRSIGTREIAACWVAITPDNRFAYTTNTGSNSITGYRVASDGRLKLLDRDGIAADTGAPSAPTEVAVNPDGTVLYVIYQATSRLAAFGINADGSLTPQTVLQLPLHPVGLMVR